MSNYSNQNRQLYVVENANQVTVKAAPDGRKFIEYAKVGDSLANVKALLRSPLIDPKTITVATATTGTYFDRPLKRYEVTIAEHGAVVATPGTIVPATDTVISGQDYLLRLRIKQFISKSDHDEYWKDGAVRGISGMTISAFYKAMAVSLGKSMARDLSPMVNIYLKKVTSGTTSYVSVMVDGKFSTPADSTDYTAIVVSEISASAQLEDHNPGLMPITPAHIELYADTVIKDGEEGHWGSVASATPTAYMINGADWQDMEYVLEGEKGSYYGEFDDPKTKIRTLKQVKDNQKYDVIEIHYHEVGSGMDAGKSEKNITIICKSTKVRGGSNADALDTPASTFLGASSSPASGTLREAFGQIFTVKTAGSVIQ